MYNIKSCREYAEKAWRMANAFISFLHQASHATTEDKDSYHRRLTANALSSMSKQEWPINLIWGLKTKYCVVCGEEVGSSGGWSGYVHCFLGSVKRVPIKMHAGKCSEHWRKRAGIISYGVWQPFMGVKIAYPNGREDDYPLIIGNY